MAPRETENNAYAKFGVTNKEHYGMLWHFREWSIYIIIIVIISLFLNNFSGSGDLLANVCIFFSKTTKTRVKDSEPNSY